jgi:hypothetical protein
MTQEQVTDKLIEDVNQSLYDAERYIRNSTSQLRKAYQQDASRLQHEIMSYRRHLYTEGYLYGSRVYPQTVQLVTGVKAVVEYYSGDIEFSDFVEYITDIRDEFNEEAKKANAVQRKHIFVLENLKRLENVMHTSAAKVQSEADASKRKAEQKAKHSKTLKYGRWVSAGMASMDGGTAAAIVAVVGELWKNHLDKQVLKAESKAAAAEANHEILRLLIESVTELVAAIECIAKFVTVLASELNALAKLGANRQEVKRLHFKVMQNKSRMLVQRCNGFIAVAPVITSDLHSITEKLDHGYIRSWEHGINQVDSSRFSEVQGDHSQKVGYSQRIRH